MAQQLTTDYSMILNQEVEEHKMKFEVEPALRFRGRTSHEYKPKKATKSNSPRHFADRNDQHAFNLLVCFFFFLNNAIEVIFFL